jgi:hypothetical protein
LGESFTGKSEGYGSPREERESSRVRVRLGSARKRISLRGGFYGYKRELY